MLNVAGVGPGADLFIFTVPIPQKADPLFRDRRPSFAYASVAAPPVEKEQLYAQADPAIPQGRLECRGAYGGSNSHADFNSQGGPILHADYQPPAQVHPDKEPVLEIRTCGP